MFLSTGRAACHGADCNGNHHCQQNAKRLPGTAVVGNQGPGHRRSAGGDGRFHCCASSSEWKMSVLTAETCCCRNSRLKTNDKTHTEES